MAVTFSHIDATFQQGTEETVDVPSASYAAGNRIAVLGFAQRDNHELGLGGDWALPSDNASLNSLTWTERAISSIFTTAGGDETQAVVWTSSVLTDTESIIVTLDAHDGGTSQFRYRAYTTQLIGSDGTLAQFDFDDGTGTLNLVLASAPSEGQILAGSMFGAGGANWTDPADFTNEEEQNTIVGYTSITNVDSTVDLARSTGAQDAIAVLLEFNAAPSFAPKIYNGTAWQPATAKIYNGTAWQASTVAVQS